MSVYCWRDNDQASLTNNFAQVPPTADQLAIKWPHDAERIDDPNWFTTAEKATVPSSRDILAGDFNEFADAIVAIEYFLRDNFGTAWAIDVDGSVSPCTGLAGWFTAGSQIASSIYIGPYLQMAATSIQVTGVSSSQPVSGYSATGTIAIPPEFGADPWASNNFVATVSAQVSGATAKGFWRGAPVGGFSGSGILSNLNSAPYVYAILAPVSGSAQVLQYFVKVVRYDASASQSTWEVPWNVTKTILDSDAINTDPLSEYFMHRQHTQYGSNPFQIFDSTYVDRPNSQVVPGSTQRFCVSGSSRGDRGADGGFMTHRELLGNTDTNIEIEFMVHGWWFGSQFWNEAADDGAWGLKGGVFLCLRQHELAEVPSSALQPGITKYFEGYVLRFGSGVVSGTSTQLRDGEEADAMSWSILKIQYHGFDQDEPDVYAWWTEDFPGGGPPNARPATGAWNYEVGDIGGNFLPMVHGTVQASAIVGRATSRANGDNGNWYDTEVDGVNFSYRFKVTNGLVSFWSREASSSTWSLLGSALDSSPVEPDDPNKYYPAGLIVNPSRGSVGADRKSRQNRLYLSNVTVRSEQAVQNGGDTLDIDLHFLMSKLDGLDAAPPLA